MIVSITAALSLALLGSVQTDAAVGVRADTAVGSAPLQLGAGNNNEATVMQQVGPAAGLRFQTERTTVIVRYFPRLYLRYPNLAGADRLLLFQRVGLRANYLMSSRVSWSLSGTAGEGEMDYTAPLAATASTPDTTTGTSTTTQGTQTSQSASTTAAQKQYPVLRIRTLAANSTMTWRESLRAQMSVSLFTSGTGALPGGYPLPNGTVWVVGSAMTQGYLVTPQDTTGVTLSYQHGYVELSPNFDNANAIWNWLHRYSIATQAGVYAGIGVIRVYGQALSWSPSGWLTWQTSGATERGFRRSLMLSGGVRTFVNTLIGTVTPTAFVQGSVMVDLAPRWSFDALLGYQMPLSSGTTAANAQLNLSTGNWQLAFHRRYGQNLFLDFGLRGYLFTDSLVVSNPQIQGTQTWAFVGFTWSESTGKDDIGAWVL